MNKYLRLSKLKRFLLNPAPYFSQRQFLKYKQQFSHKFAPYSWLDDRFYLEYIFYKRFNKRLELHKPVLFPDKLQWLKLYDRNPLYTQLADKFRVREYVQQKVGEEYLNELIGVYAHPADIDWSKLPTKFVLKANHGSRSNLICTNKHELDIKQAVADLTAWLNTDYYAFSREWPYKHIQRLIICEAFLEGHPKWGLMDYKILCFDGKPMIIHLHVGRYTDHRVSYFDLNWNRQPYTLSGVKEIDEDIPKPDNFAQMIDIASTLSQGIPYCSVDLYNTNGKIIFGEITFTTAGGFRLFIPEKYNRVFGDLIKLPKKGLLNR